MADKVWVAGALVGFIWSLASALSRVPHYGDSFVPWSVLILCVCLIVLQLKLDRLVYPLPWGIHTVLFILIGFLVPLLIADKQLDNKASLIARSGVQATAEVVALRRANIPSTKYFHQNAKNVSLQVIYRYSVGSETFVEADYIEDAPGNRQAYREGTPIGIRYAAPDPSVSQLSEVAGSVMGGNL